MDIVYKDEKLRSHYLQYGFAIVQDFLSPEEIGVLLDAVNKYSADLQDAAPFSTSTDSRSSGFRQAMRDVINEVVHPGKTQAYFEGYTPFYSNLLIKKPHAHSEMVLHTDWSITDEARYTPLQIWIPLTDVNRQNGTLAVIPGSHQLTHIYRGCGVDEPYMKYEQELLRDYLYYLEIPKGTAVLYHPGILHYSPSNLSEQVRLAVLVSYHPSAISPVLYYKERFSIPGNISVFGLSAQFFDTWDKKSKPLDLRKCGTVRQPRPSCSKNVFLSKLSDSRYEKSIPG